MEAVLTRRDLNRATLARQHLLERTTRSAVDVVSHLAGMQAQAQAPFPPYFGLWSRVDGFTAEELVDLLESRTVVRCSLQRGTVHLVTAADALWLRPLLAPLYERFVRVSPATAGRLDGVDLDALAAAGRTLLDDDPLTLAEFGRALAPTWPDRDPRALGHAVPLLTPLVQVPPRALWGRSGPPRLAPLETWVGAPLDPDLAVDDLVLRYLAAFGPASVLDAQRWAGLAFLGETFERLRPRLVTFRDEDGRELFDLPDAPRPGGDAGAPIRLVAAYDDLLLGHADRTRIYDVEHQRRLIPVNAVIPATVLVDGFVDGTWTWAATRSRAEVTITPFSLWPRRVRADVEAEARHLLARAAPEVPAHEVHVTEPA
ncbi:winged helix DNA-binding domain-containing protein [Iamia sp. SCSIO 61187]|uniref:winged helix DNA-binding domain-containing protein n=1 Tax=Iamia sp. SCSIO 61187 TaxID=2722752 RepID=UPI001C635922|nr:winged helix DNA-binding domain-containing protein [Iamia sp. SCSIO 61187]QYG95148.1 winged helix DNA-binding domain-containing protein [Iamia sp. SCSIO 61187]